MCLYLTPASKKIQARKDIVCYKVMIPISKTTALSSIYRKLYQLNKANTYIPLVIIGKKVQKGYHSFKTISKCQSNTPGHHHYECIIPKGSTYIKGQHNELVSEKIIIKKKGPTPGSLLLVVHESL